MNWTRLFEYDGSVPYFELSDTATALSCTCDWPRRSMLAEHVVRRPPPIEPSSQLVHTSVSRFLCKVEGFVKTPSFVISLQNV